MDSERAVVEFVADTLKIPRDRVTPEARFVVAHAEQGFTSNVPLACFMDAPF